MSDEKSENTTPSVDTTGGFSMVQYPGWVAWVVVENGKVALRAYFPPGAVPSDNYGNPWTKENPEN